ATLQKKLTFGNQESDLPGPDVYQFRLSLIGYDGTTIVQDDSDYFRVGDVEATIATVDVVDYPLEAIVDAIKKSGQRLPPMSIRALLDEGDDLCTRVEIHFDGIPRRWIIEQPRRLAELQANLLTEPRSLCGFSLELDPSEPEHQYHAF